MGFLTGRLMRTLRPSVAATLGLGSEYRRYWEDSNERARHADGPLWVALGNSTAQGIGASAPDRGYVGQLLVRLHDEQRRPWLVVNLSVTGARVADVVREQVPRINEAGDPELVTCAAGANDIIRLGFRRVADAMRELIRALPPRAVLATIPQGLLPSRTRDLNQIIRAEAPAAGLRIADAWAHTGPPWQGKYAADDFHPNDTGYGEWCAAFAEAIGLDGS
jgi:lysophospholipase L1-like esterase